MPDVVQQIGLGIGTPQSGGNATLTQGLNQLAASDPEPISKAIISMLADISSFFHGANPLQVPASKIVESFQLYVHNLFRLVREGWISQSEAQFGMQAALQAGTQYLQQSNLGSAGQAGVVNLQQAINQSISALGGLSGVALKPEIDINSARMLYVGNTHGYDETDARILYPESVQAAMRLTDSFLTSLPARSAVSTVLSTVEGGVNQAVSALGTSLGIDTSTLKTLALILVGVIVLKKVFL